MRRREFTLLVGGAAMWPLAARAQSNFLRVGLVLFNPRSAPYIVGFEKRMAELGYEENKNFALEFLLITSVEEFPSAYAELARRKVDIFVAAGSELALRAALAAAGTLPIVLLAIDFDPIAKGYVTGLARTRGNVTGIFVRQLELAAKRVRLTREALPKAHTLGLWWDAVSRDQAEAAAAVANFLGFAPRLIEVPGQPRDYAGAIGQMADVAGQPIMIGVSPVFLRDRAAILPLLLAQRSPAIAGFRQFVEVGALMSYGIDLVDLYRDLAGYVDRIAKGAKPADLPMAQPTKFEFVINLKTANALGLEVPATLLAQADEVIE
jgi:putative ABC transport system substrate-binding protein